MNDRELMQMALDALEHGLPIIEDFGGKEQLQLQHKAIAVLYEALRAALAQPEPEPTRSQKLRDAGYTRRPKGWSKDGEEPEPVAWMHTTATGDVYFRKKPHDKVFNPQPVYTAPLQREWVELTEEDHEDFCKRSNLHPRIAQTLAEFIEAKLKEKNGA